MIPVAKPLIQAEEQAAVAEVLASGMLAQGSKVRRFEEQFAEWCGVRHAVAVSSGTAALHLSLLALGIGPGDEVITTPFSFVASANCALFVGATPVFADIEADTYCLDAAEIRRRITPQTRALVVVHLYGHPCNMDEVDSIVREHGLLLIEDACQAHGAEWRGRKVGGAGLGCFSFYPTKNMTTGEGGMVTTDDAGIAKEVRLLREHGAAVRYVHEKLGYNQRMTDIQAAIGIVQLGRLDGWNARRRQNAAYLSERLAAAEGVTPPVVAPNAGHVFHQYTVRTQSREALAAGLQARGVGSAIHYATPLHHQPLYRSLGHAEFLPVAETAARQVLSLPVHPGLTDEDLVAVADAVVAAAAESAAARVPAVA